MARRSPSSGCSPPGGCRSPPPTCCGRRCAGVGAHHCPLGLHALWGLRATGVVAVPAAVPQRGALASRRCVLWGRRRSVPGRGGCLPPLRGASEFRRFPLAGRPPSGRAAGARYPRAAGAAVRVWGPSTVPWALGGGGWPCTVARGVRCQALSLSLPPVLWDGRPGFCDPCVLGAVGVGVVAQHRPHAFHRCEGRRRSGASPPLAARPVGGLSGSDAHVLRVRAGSSGGPALSPWLARPVGAACRGGGWAPPLPLL